MKNIYVGGKRVDEEKLATDGWAVEPVAGWLSVLGRALFYAALLVFCALAWGLALKACTSAAHAQSGSCEFIKDADERHYCRACSGRPGECEFIKRGDLRHKCRALCKMRGN